MLQYIIRRLLFNIPVLFGVTLIVFFAIRLLPGNIVDVLIAQLPTVTQEGIDAMRLDMGLDVPAPVQYVRWVTRMARGDLGTSMWTREPAFDRIKKAIPVSAEIAIMAILIAESIAVPIGIISAIRQDSPADYILRIYSITMLSVPSFVLATLIVVLPALWWYWVPPLGYAPLFKDPLNNLQQFIPAAFAIGARGSGSTMRMTRSAMLEVLREDYIRTAWAKGLRERMVVVRHAMKNALIPVVTLWGTSFGFLLGGSVIVESVFGLPGVGLLTLESIRYRDYTQLQANVLFLSAVYVTMNLVVDITYAWLDPRIRYS